MIVEVNTLNQGIYVTHFKYCRGR